MPTSASGESGGLRSVPGGFDVVTGAFSYSGSAIARDLLAAGRAVRTVTGHPGRALSGTPFEVRPLDFADPAGLTASLRGAGTLYNTYWVRFPRGPVDHQTAVANSRTLFDAARDARVRRIVHVSITHPGAASTYSYFRGKAEVESILGEAGVSYAILRPAILFGGEGVLINNIAWLLRRLPVFAVGGTGAYRIRPIHACRAPSSRRPLRFWDGPCVTRCSPVMSTAPWPRGWPTPTAQRPARSLLPGG
jgi:uncharacterized protein YbjT (DUF2867 family)